jgi:hypothetical protein
MSNRPAMPAGLPACKQYINFKLVPRARGGTDKIPIDQAGNVIDAHDPSKWVDAATAWLSPWNMHGIGFVGTPGWILIDLDKALRDGVWSPLVAELRTKLWGAYADVSPSGTGYHLIMRGTLPDGHKCKMEWGEIYSLGRFLTITGNHASGDANWDASDHSEWLVERFGLRGEPLPALPDEGRSELWRGPEDDDALLAIMLGQGAHTPGQMFDGQATARQVWNMEVDALARTYPADNRSDGLTFDYSSVDMSLMSHLSWLTGRDIERMQRLFERWPGYRAWKYQRSRGYHMHRILSRGCTNKHVLGERTTALVGREAGPAEGAVSEPGEFYAYLPDHNFYFRPKGDFWPAASVDDLIGSVALANGTTIKATKYLARHHAVHDRTWWPGKPEIIDNYLFRDGGMVEAVGKRSLNMFRPPLPPMGNAHDVKPWLDHIAMLYPEHWGVLVRWMAFIAQNPGVKVNWAVVLGGGQRIGKDSIVAPLIRAVGEWNFKDVTPDLILKSDFNEYLQCCVLRINEMKDTGNGGMFQLYNRLKTVIAAPPGTHRINPKGEKPFIIPNLNATVMTTNYQTGGMYLPSDDGRHFVVWSTIVRAVVGDAHYIRLWSWLNNGGMENCAAYLMAIDVRDFDPMSPPEKTAAFWAMVDGGQSDESNDLRDVIDKFGDTRFTIDELAFAAKMANNHNLHDWLKSAGKFKIRRAIEDAGAHQDWNPADVRRGRWIIAGGKQVTCYKRMVG